MATRLDSIRTALNNNEIIFKTVAATLLSFMALIVSAAQLFTARQEISLSSLQEHIAEAQALPQFEVAIHQKRNDETGKFDDVYLEVINSGGPVHEFKAEAASFLRVSATIPNNSSSPIPWRTASFDMPFGGYFGSQGVSPAGKGLLVSMWGYHNDAEVDALSKSARQAADDAKWGSFFVQTRVFVELGYRDMLDRFHIDYYEVPTVGGGWRMKGADGKAVFEQWRQPDRPDLSKLTAETLLTDATKRVNVGATPTAPPATTR